MILRKRPKFLRRITIALIVMLLIFGVLLMGFLYFNMGPQNTNTYTGPRKVIIEKKNGRYSFYKDGKPFLVKGGSGVDHIRELSESGGNTIMCWDTSKLKSVFREAEKYHLSVIIGLDIPSANTDFYRNKKNLIGLYNACISIVSRYKD